MRSVLAAVVVAGVLAAGATGTGASTTASTGAQTPGTHPPASRPAPGVLGFYAGYDNPAGVRAAADLLKHPVAQAMDFLDGTSWATIEHSPETSVAAWGPSGYKMTWSIPMLPDRGGTLREGATGAYDGHFAAVARYLVAHGQADTLIRIGWEFNGFWFTWSAVACPPCFVTYWRHIVDAMRAVPGAHFRFEWTPVAGIETSPPEVSYPGNAWVDIVGLDVYDEVYHLKGGPTRWRALQTESSGIDWAVAFAKAHHKPMAFPEWGLGFPPAGGGDNAYFITQMARLIASRHAVSAIYWEYGASRLERSPRAARAMAAAFG